MAASADPKTRERSVAVWKDVWLPPSETFIANQIAAMSRWTPLLLGSRSIRDGLNVQPDLVTLGQSESRKLGHMAALTTAADPRMRRALRGSQVELVHAHFMYGGAQVLRLASVAGLPLVVTAHGNDVTELPRSETLFGTWFRRRLPHLVEHAAAFIAVSDFIAEQLIRIGAPESKVTVLPIGIPLTPQGSAPHTREGVVFVGRLVEKKGVFDLLRAMSVVQGDLLQHVPVRIVGDGPLRSELEQLAKSLDIRAEFMGTLPPLQVATVLAASAIFVGPSRTASEGDSEGFGMVFLEAALHRLPVVAYRHGGVPEAVVHEHTGYLAREGDIRGLAHHIRQLLVNPELGARLGANGYRRVIGEFDVRSRTSDLETFYDWVVSSRTTSNVS